VLRAFVELVEASMDSYNAIIIGMGQAGPWLARHRR
jgi:hypothetical protein